MEIISQSREFSTIEAYQLLRNPETQKMSNNKDIPFEVDCWCIFNDVKKTTGEVQEILSIKTKGGEVFATNSKTFMDEFLIIWNLFSEKNENVPPIKVISGTSKNGRNFITCTVAVWLQENLSLTTLYLTSQFEHLKRCSFWYKGAKDNEIIFKKRIRKHGIY